MLQPNDKIGNLTLLISYTKKDVDASRTYWKCQCVCGNTVDRRDAYLKARPQDQSCGCMHPIKGKHGKTGKDHFKWKGVGDIPKQYYWNLRKNAENRGFTFEITLEQMWEKFLEQDRKCVLTGLELNFLARRQQKNGNEQTASMDRIDPLKGYTIDNVRWVHKTVNKMKMEFSDEVFKEMCRRVATKFPA